MADNEEKYEFRRKLHGGIVFFGMIINFLVIGAIFYFVLTNDPNQKPPASLKYGYYHGPVATEPAGGEAQKKD